jgi:glycosyltransferase involved in cell wall biosynthesis
MGARISVVVNTLNEEARLPYALRSVHGWADEIIVVDMHSEDRTAEVARGFGAAVYLHPRASVVEPARAFALAQATGEWILLLDADELIPAPLAAALRQLAREDGADVARIPRLNYMLGAPLRYTGWGPVQDRQLRFFRRGSIEASATIHAGLRPVEGARIIDLPDGPGRAIAHFSYLDVEHFLEKLNRYTTVEAAQARERGERAAPVRALMRAGKEFLARYLRHGGYRDGWRGFYLSLFMAHYRLATAAKLTELERVGDRAAIAARYEAAAERILGAAGPRPT